MWVEEQQLFPLAEQMFSDADWAELEHLCEATRDPLFEQTLARYEDLYRYIVEVGSTRVTTCLP
jgi:hemerythrin-like domain-containing protein